MGQMVSGKRGKVRVFVIHKSRGFSLGSMLVVVALVLAIALPALKSIPSMLEYFSVKRATSYAKDRSSNRKDVAANFDKQAQIDNISSIRGEDLDVNEDETGRIRSIGFEYRTEVKIYGPLSFLITYSGTQ
ncbi:putative transmembrane protein [Cupriavidus sp. U2]|uniref:DUF4845 domain-containing protein n=2 Tax=unclassified Cupriavidus TaxID=2640874 RepID=UPI00129E9AEE|nr:DUF4845 domain-containing protein [Cupriavidus sp. U2]KAI3589859.1 putative transmembrane protein [Cupriavidus sp. U2]